MSYLCRCKLGCPKAYTETCQKKNQSTCSNCPMACSTNDLNQELKRNIKNLKIYQKKL